MSFLLILGGAAIWTAVLLLGRPTARLRRQTRWLVHPRADIVGPEAFAAEVVPLAAEAGDLLRQLGFEPFVTVRMHLGTSGGASVSQVQVVWTRPISDDVAVVQWQQNLSGRWGAWSTGVDLHLVRPTLPTVGRAAVVRLADPSTGQGGRLAWATPPGRVRAAYEAFLADGGVGEARPWRYSRVADYVAAAEQLAGEHMAALAAGHARPDRSGQTYVYTWRAALTRVARHQWSGGRPQPSTRGFEVIPWAERHDRAGVD